MSGEFGRRGVLLAVVAALTACSSAADPHPATSAASPSGAASAPPTPRDPVTIRIEGEAMVPTLANGTSVIADRAAYAAAKPQRGDIVVLHPPGRPGQTFVKRILGLPGDLLEIDGRYVDASHPDAAAHAALLVEPGGRGPWHVIREPYLPDQSIDPWDELDNCCDPDGRATALPTPLAIPPGAYFVLGDNRNRSADSRSFGLVPAANLVAKCLDRLNNGATTWLYAPGLTPSLSP